MDKSHFLTYCKKNLEPKKDFTNQFFLSIVGKFASIEFISFVEWTKLFVSNI